MRLLVTRPEPDASILAEELRGLGHEPVLQPLLQLRTLDFNLKVLRAAQAIIITSSNCLRAIEDIPGLEESAGIPLYCVGEETARRAQATGFRNLLATAETAAQLAARVLSSVRKDQLIVHITGEHQAFDLEGALAREGLSIQTLPVYSMETCRELSPSVDAMLKAGEIDGVILMSPRTAETYVSLYHWHGMEECAKTPAYFCISENVAAKLASIKPNDVRVPAKPNRKALLELLHAD